MALWAELSPDLEELDGYGGGPVEVVNKVSDLLYDIEKRLSGKLVAENLRRPAFQEEFAILVPGWRDLAMK